MGYHDWKQWLALRFGTVAVAFTGGMVVEAAGDYSAWAIALVAFSIGLACAGVLVACDPWLERWHARLERRRAADWPEF